ncbi:hypothetical protein ANN_09232 [Periplaneta americana]|uniref:Uncharacterized protein n=1 Tax=Periplaneta americana TaxID=6978 RepID=A0ABQ8TNN8_PERAM|nr:hypothetical protein ANN_09232 [Periplaneta americana]
MAGLCEGGNEPSVSLKAICKCSTIQKTPWGSNMKAQVSIILGYVIERQLAKRHGGWKSNTVAEGIHHPRNGMTSRVVATWSKAACLDTCYGMSARSSPQAEGIFSWNFVQCMGPVPTSIILNLASYDRWDISGRAWNYSAMLPIWTTMLPADGS